jgi:hypothetical protein
MRQEAAAHQDDREEATVPDEPRPVSRSDRGDAACWLSEVCPDCGALDEDPTGPCWRCGAVRGEDDPDAVRPTHDG